MACGIYGENDEGTFYNAYEMKCAGLDYFRTWAGRGAKILLVDGRLMYASALQEFHLNRFLIDAVFRKNTEMWWTADIAARRGIRPQVMFKRT